LTRGPCSGARRPACAATVPGRAQELARGRLRAVAVDGKTCRGARRPDGTRVRLLGVAKKGAHLLDHQEVDAKAQRDQPLLHAQVRALPWRQVPADSVTRERGHGRAETRTLKAAHVSRLDLTWLPSAPPSSRPSKTPVTRTSSKAAATKRPPPKPFTSTGSIRTDADIHGTPEPCG
jgi:hypothetical protein